MPSNTPYKRRCKLCRKLDLDDNWHICLNCGGYYSYPEEGNDKFCEICIEKYLRKEKE